MSRRIMVTRYKCREGWYMCKDTHSNRDPHLQLFADHNRGVKIDHSTIIMTSVYEISSAKLLRFESHETCGVLWPACPEPLAAWLLQVSVLHALLRGVWLASLSSHLTFHGVSNGTCLVYGILPLSRPDTS
jgi:hypothetical protein